MPQQITVSDEFYERIQELNRKNKAGELARDNPEGEGMGCTYELQFDANGNAIDSNSVGDCGLWDKFLSGVERSRSRWPT